jgi:glycosyltransferase involved in cell wall biosynthesis
VTEGITISVVVPAWNAERYLGEALDSLLAQTRVPTEVLVIDDGSTDGTADVAEKRGPPVRCVRREHQGPAAARNAGIREARGELLAFLDADDLWLPAKLERQLEALSAQPSVGIVTTRIRDFWVPELAHLGSGDECPREGLMTQTGLARREVFDQVGLLEEDLTHYDAQAWELQARAMGVGIARLDEVLVLRRLHHHNLSRRRGPESAAGLMRILQRVRKEGRA